MSEITQEDALRQAAELVGEALKEAEARCGLLGQYINDCDSKGSRTAAWSEALRELHALHERRTQLMLRRSLIQQALDCPVGESPSEGAARSLPRTESASLRRQDQAGFRHSPATCALLPAR